MIGYWTFIKHYRFKRSVHNELSHQKSALFVVYLLKYFKTLIIWTIESPDDEGGRVNFRKFDAERVGSRQMGFGTFLKYIIGLN